MNFVLCVLYLSLNLCHGNCVNCTLKLTVILKRNILFYGIKNTVPDIINIITNNNKNQFKIYKADLKLRDDEKKI